MAQITAPVTFDVMPKGVKQPGTYTTASAVVPDGARSVYITDLLTDADASDPANSYTVLFESSPDGITWKAYSLEYWTGGTYVDKVTGAVLPTHMKTGFGIYAPGENGGVGVFWGMRVRATIDNPQRLSLGFQVTVNP